MEKDPQGYLAGGLPYARTDARGGGDARKGVPYRDRYRFPVHPVDPPSVSSVLLQDVS